MKKITIIIIVIAFFLGNFSNFTTADSDELDILNKELFQAIAENKVGFEKIEQCVLNLIYPNTRLNDLDSKQLTDFDFINDKVRLELILSDESKIVNLQDYNEDIEIELSVENLVQALVPANLIEELSQQEFVNFIRKPVECTPFITSEGVEVIGADLVHTAGYYGEGIKVAVIDVGFEDYDINPEIPPGRIVEAISYRAGHDIEYGGPHGSACTELVLDVAPLVDLYLYSCGTISEFNSAVNRALSQNVDVISFSCGWVGINDYDGLGTACNIVNNARSNGVLFVVAIGNEAESHYEGTYTDNDDDDFHEYDNNGIEVLSLGYLFSGTLVHLILTWNDWPTSNQNYDLLLFDSGLNLVAFSMNIQSGSQPPFESIIGYTTYGSTYYVVIYRWDATWDVHFELYSYNEFVTYNHPESSLICPADATGATTVGATYWEDDSLENFSSRGPTNDNRIKPDVTAPDGVSTWEYGNGNFYGTSASCPHVSGAAALLKSIDSSLTADDLQDLLESTALDLGSSGKDNLYGSGRIDVWDAFNTINQPPNADFTYSPSNPTTQDIIQFTDTSTDDGTIVSWFWDFDDGTTSIAQHPSHQYADDGDYTVTLNVTDDDGVTNDTSQQIVVSNVDPTADFTYSPVNPITNDTISFTDTSTDVDGMIVSWSWNFDDGNTSVEQNPAHQYIDNGTYNVILNVTDDDGDTNETSQQIVVSNIAPTADFSWSPTNSTTDDIIQFTDNSTDPDGYIVSWSWNFDDGNISTIQHPTHQYAEGNTYNVTLNVTNDDGITDEISQHVIVNVIPIASFSYTPSNPNTSDIISFTDQSIDTYGPITSWLWDFGDESNSTEQNPTHQYSDNGTYTVTLNVTDKYGATNETSQQIVVSNVGPIANFNFSPPIPNDLQIVTFTDTSTDSDGYVVSWSWDFGDGNTSILQNPTHQYIDNGTYNVILNVTDDDGAVDETSQEITIANVPPVVNFTHSPSIPTINDMVQFNDTSIDLDGTIVSWLWDFGDGNTSTSRNTTHQYSDNITYNVTLTVTDNDGDASYITKEIITKIIYSRILVGNETTIDLQNETDITVIINTTASTTINITKYSGNPTGEDISGNITSIGKYIDVEVENESVIVWPLDIKIYYTQDDLNNSNIDESQLLGIYFWNDTIDEWQLYDDTGVNTSYNHSGYEGYCWADAWHLTPLTPGGDNEPPSKVTGLTVTDAKDGKLDLSWNSASDNVEIDHYKIYRDGGFLINKTTTSYRDTGLTNGQSYSYQASAVDTSGNEGEKSDSKSGTSTASGGGNGGGTPFIPSSSPSNNPPIANASAGEPYHGFVGEEITFDGSLSYDPDEEDIVSWHWDFGDGGNGTGETTTHTYSKPGTYLVVLTVSDDEGDEDTYETTAIISQPNRISSAPNVDGPQEGTQNTEYTYTAVSTDGDNDTIQYHFDWDDGTNNITEYLANGTLATQLHMWTSAGKYTIRVLAFDNQTPSDTTHYAILIDTILVEDIGYITDDDADGTYDTFHGDGIETELGKEGDTYLIDTNGDGNWNYMYNPAEGLSDYKEREEIEIPWMMVVGIAIAIAIIAIIVYLYKKEII